MKQVIAGVYENFKQQEEKRLQTLREEEEQKAVHILIGNILKLIVNYLNIPKIFTCMFNIVLLVFSRKRGGGFLRRIK